MAAQFLPIIKVIAPYIAQIATAAIPAFTSKKEAPKSDEIKTDQIVTKQIEELQDAASKNANSVKVLAENLQQAINNIDIAAQKANKKIATYKIVIFLSLSLSIISLSTSLYLLLQ